MNEQPTKRQQEVLDYIREYQLEYGASPTLREIRGYLNVASDNSVLKHIKGLVKKGYIQKDDTPRGIKLLQSVKEKLQSATASIPVLGFIPAGGPVTTEEYVEDHISVDLADVKMPEACFALRVKGDSMIEVGIFEGDMVLADRSRQPRNGDVVVALVDGGNTVKTYVKEKGQVYLRAENKDYPDIYPENELTTQGVVIKLLRSYV